MVVMCQTLTAGRISVFSCHLLLQCISRQFDWYFCLQQLWTWSATSLTCALTAPTATWLLSRWTNVLYTVHPCNSIVLCFSLDMVVLVFSYLVVFSGGVRESYVKCFWATWVRWRNCAQRALIQLPLVSVSVAVRRVSGQNCSCVPVKVLSWYLGTSEGTSEF